MVTRKRFRLSNEEGGNKRIVERLYGGRQGDEASDLKARSGW